MKHSLDQLLGLHCASALVGVEPANLVCVPQKEIPCLEQELEIYQRVFAKKGVAFQTLCTCPQHQLILVFRPAMVEHYLNQEPVARLLEQYGYNRTQPLTEKLERLRQRMETNKQFPHEIGLFLGYPVEDVVGFIHQKGQNFKLSGPWKVYGDVERAKKSFQRIARVSTALRQRMEQGLSLFQVFSLAA